MSTENIESVVADTEATAAELAKPEDVTAYIEERREQEAEDTPPADETDALAREVRDRHPELKKASRYERLKKARDSYKAEAEELRHKYEGRSEQTDTRPMPAAINTDAGALENSLKFAADQFGEEKFQAAYRAFADHVRATQDQAAYHRVMSDPDPGKALVEWHEQGGHQQAPQQPQDPYQAALEQGRQHANYEAAIAQREAQIRHDTAINYRCQEFARAYPDFHQVLEDVRDIQTIPVSMAHMIEQSEFGPAIMYALAKDVWEQGIIFELANLDGNLIAQAQLVGRLEQYVRHGFQQATAPQRATRAPRPIAPIKGGSGGPRDLHSLSQSEDAGAYISARRGQG